MKIKTSELIGPALDWAVASIMDTDPEWGGFSVHRGEVWSNGRRYSPSADWSQGGPIIYRECICTSTEHGDPWRARFGRARITFDGRAYHYHHEDGPTPLIAAMRCFVASKLGNEVEIPEELCQP